MKKAILMLFAASLLMASAAYAGEHKHRGRHHKKSKATQSLNSLQDTHSIVRVS